MLAMDPCSPRAITWSKADPFGAEFVEVRLGRDELGARGVALGSAPLPYRLDYTFETVSNFVTARLVVSARGDGWARSLDLRRTGSGDWEETWEEGGVPHVPLQRSTTDVAALSGALDIDLGLSPFFNTMPVLRHGLLRGGKSIDFVIAWVSVPDLGVHRSLQRYSFVRETGDKRSVVRFESLATDGFVADITYDAEGFVVDYPGIGTRLP
jgi:uncharacterized protein